MSSPGVGLIVRLLSDQEIFHQKLLKELFEQTQLARALGLWQGEKPPEVDYEPDGGLFDLKLRGHGADATVGIELKVNAFLSESQEERQRAFAAQHKMRRAYILLGTTYYCWRAKLPRVNSQSLIISPQSLESALAALLPEIRDTALGSIVVEYLPYLTQRASYWQKPYAQSPNPEWLSNDWHVFRFLDELGTHWPSAFEVYEMPHGGGYDRILNPRSPGGNDRRVLTSPTWARFFWEIVSERVRFKVHVPSKEHRESVRSLCRKAFRGATQKLDEKITEVGRLGEHMTIGQLDLDVFGAVLDPEGRMVPENARALYERCERILDEMLSQLRASTPFPALPSVSS